MQNASGTGIRTIFISRKWNGTEEDSSNKIGPAWRRRHLVIRNDLDSWESAWNGYFAKLITAIMQGTNADNKRKQSTSESIQAPGRKLKNSPPIAPYLPRPELFVTSGTTRPSGSNDDIESLTVKITAPNEARGFLGDRKSMSKMGTADQTVALWANSEHATRILPKDKARAAHKVEKKTWSQEFDLFYVVDQPEPLFNWTIWQCYLVRP